MGAYEGSIADEGWFEGERTSLMGCAYEGSIAHGGSHGIAHTSLRSLAHEGSKMAVRGFPTGG